MVWKPIFRETLVVVWWLKWKNGDWEKSGLKFLLDYESHRVTLSLVSVLCTSEVLEFLGGARG